MRVSIQTGPVRSLDFDVPDRNLLYVIDRGEAQPLKNIDRSLRFGLKKPLGTPPLFNLVHKGDKVVVVVDDITRPTPQKLLLPIVLDELIKAGVEEEDIEILIALGTHRFMSEREIKDRFGEEATERFEVVNHDYHSEKEFVNLGKTASGTPITVNKRIIEADFVMAIGNIVPHCYSGWAGGGKIIQPGISGEDTTAYTHLMAGKIKPLSKVTGNLDNPVRIEIDEVAIKAGLKMIVNTILNADERISSLMIGDPIKAFRRGVEIAMNVYCPTIPAQADIVVVSSYPADIDYWQAHKPTVYASLSVRKGGVVILVTPCPEKISAQHPEMREWAKYGYGEILEAVDRGDLKDKIAAGALLLHSQAMEHNAVICISEHLDETDKEALGFKHAESVDDALEDAFRRIGRSAKVGILRCGEISPKLSHRFN